MTGTSKTRGSFEVGIGGGGGGGGASHLRVGPAAAHSPECSGVCEIKDPSALTKQTKFVQLSNA